MQGPQREKRPRAHSVRIASESMILSVAVIEESVERVRPYRGTGPYERALRKQGVGVEPLFGEAKEWHGMIRFRLRTLKKVNIEALVIAAGQNVKRLLVWRARGPRSVAQAMALRRLEPPPLCYRNRVRRRHRCVPRSVKRSFSTSWIFLGTERQPTL